MGFDAELHVASRYLIGTRRWTPVVTVTLISLLGLGLGVFALVVTLSLLDGFQSGIRSQIEAQAPVLAGAYWRQFVIRVVAIAVPADSNTLR